MKYFIGVLLLASSVCGGEKKLKLRIKSWDGKYYALIAEKVNFGTAAKTAKALKGFLVEPKNSLENKMILEWVKHLGGCWLGMNDRSKEGQWLYFSDKKMVQYFNWYNKRKLRNTLTRNVMAMRATGKWAPINGHNFKKVFVVEWNKKPKLEIQ